VDARTTDLPDLGEIRYRDPAGHRTIWAGLDLGGAAVPRRLGLFDARVWTLRLEPSWAVALARHVALGGRHALSWYDATTGDGAARSRIHEHQLELSASPIRLAGRRIEDRLSLTYGSHAVAAVTVDGVSFKLGGVNDRVLALAYGMSHPAGRRWSIDWQAQLRHVWVLRHRQRQARASLRAVFEPRPRHQVLGEAVAYLVHRDADQVTDGVPRASVVGQFRLGYRWMSRMGLGLDVQARFNTHFMVGQAPVFEYRAEALDTIYGELVVGFRSVF